MSRRVAWDSWYGTAVWQRLRKHQLDTHPLCKMCLERDGSPVPATIADHVESHGGDWNKFRLGRLQSLCKSCHDSAKKLVEARGYDTAIGADGYPTDPRHPWFRE